MPTKKLAQSLSAKEAPIERGDIGLKPLTQLSDSLFLAGCMGELRTRDLVSRDENEENVQALHGYIDAFVETEYFHADQSNIQNIVSFALWLDNEQWRYEVPILFSTSFITVSITMQAPSGSITIGMEAVPLSDEHGPIIKAMHKQLSDNIKTVFGKGTDTSNTTNKLEKRQTEPPKEDKGKWYDFDTIRVQEHNEQLKAYLIPLEGRWQAHGVRLFNNVADKYGIDIPEEEGDFAYTGSMLVKMNGQYPNIAELANLEEA